MAIPLRNVAAGLAVLDAYYVWPERPGTDDGYRPIEEFRRLNRDLYVPASDISFWQAAIREPSDPLHGPLREAIRAGSSIGVDLLYGDHEGGQRTISRFSLTPRLHGGEEEPWMWMCTVARHWNLDRDDPR